MVAYLNKVKDDQVQKEQAESADSLVRRATFCLQRTLEFLQKHDVSMAKQVWSTTQEVAAQLRASDVLSKLPTVTRTSCVFLA
jgi:hypothetical protein